MEEAYWDEDEDEDEDDKDDDVDEKKKKGCGDISRPRIGDEKSEVGKENKEEERER